VIGSITGSAAIDAPLNTNSSFNYNQTIYHQTDLGDAGVITRIYYRWNATVSPTLNHAWEVYMTHIPADRTQFTSATDWYPVSELSNHIVFSGAVFIAAGPTWIEIVLDTPFVYDGISNILVAVHQKYPNWETQNRFAANTTTGSERVLRVRMDSGGPYNLTGTAPTTATGNSVAAATQTGYPTIAFSKIVHQDVLATPVDVHFSYETYYRTIRIQNMSDTAQTVTGVQLVGEDTGHFSLWTAGATWGSIPAGEYREIAVQINPTSPDLKNASLEIRNDATVLQTIPLSGEMPAYLIGETIHENFTSVATGQRVPLGWKRINNGSGSSDQIEVVSETAIPGHTRAIRINNGATAINDDSRSMLIVSPPINNLSEKRIRFQTRVSSPGTELIVGRMLNPADLSTFVPIHTIMPGTVYSEFNVLIGAGQGSFFALRHGGGATGRTIHIAAVTIEDVPSVAEIAVSTTTINFGNMNEPGAMPPPERTVTIKNMGGVALNITSIVPSLSDMGTIAISPTSIPPIEPGDQQIVTFTYDHGAFTGAMTGSITINSDDPATPAYLVDISAFTVHDDLIAIGTGTVNSTVVPIATNWNFSYSQTIYYPHEITRPGLITNIFYHYNGHSSWASYNTWTVFMGHTAQNIFTGTSSWGSSVPHSSLDQVFSGVVGLDSVVPSGGWIHIQLDEPFYYNGVDNLVISVSQNVSGFNSSATFSATNAPTGENRSWRLANDNSQINPVAGTPTTSFTHSLAYPNIRLMISQPTGEPNLVISPRNYNFSPTEINYTPTREFTMMNSGGGVINVSDISITGDAVFSIIAENYDSSLEGQTTGSFRVQFSPTIAGGPYTAIATVTHDSGNPVEITISGTSFDNSIAWDSWFEDFNAGAFPPEHWTRGTTPLADLSPSLQPTGTSLWTTQNFANANPVHEFARSAYFNNVLTRNEWLITPQIVLGSETYRVEFDAMVKMWDGHAAPISTQDDKRFVVLARRVSEPWSLEHIIAEWNGDGFGTGFSGQPLTGSYDELFTPIETLIRRSIILPPTLSDGGIQLAFVGCSTLSSPDTRLYLDNVSISQNVDGPNFSIMPDVTSFDFGTVLTGEPVSRPFTITNNGSAAGLVVESVSITNTENYRVTSFTEPVSLDVGEPLHITVALVADSEGSLPATLTITYNIGSDSIDYEVEFAANAVESRIMSFPHIETFTTPISAGNPVFDFWRRHHTQFNESGTTTLLPPMSQTTAWTSNSTQWGVWNFMNQSGHELGTAATVNIWSSGVPNRCHWLVSPLIVIPDFHALQLNFKYARSAFSSNSAPAAASATQKFLVIVSADGGLTWSPADVVARWDGDSQNHESGFSMNMNSIQNFSSSTTGYYDIDIDLSEYEGAIKIAFYAESQSGGDFNFYIDDVHLSTIALGDIPVFAISPADANITIPATIVGETTSRTFIIRNRGGADGLLIHNITLDGHGFFSLADVINFPIELDAGGNYQFVVRYEPETGGHHTTTMTIDYEDFDGRGTHVVSISANAIDRRIFLTPATPYTQSFVLNENQNPTAGNELHDFWSRYRHTFNESEPNILPPPVNQSQIWWQSTSVWGLRNFSNHSTHTLGRAAHVNIFGTSASEWLVTPTIVVPEFHDLTIGFKYARSDRSGNSPAGVATETQKFMVIISRDDGATWESANVVAKWDGDSYNHADGISMDMNAVQNFSNATSYHEHSVNIADCSGEIRIAFYGESLSGGADFNFYIDDITLSVAELEYLPPVNVAATPDGNRALKITWDMPPFHNNRESTRNIANLHGFNIYRDGGTVPVYQVDYFDGMELEWRDTGLTNGREYSYRMRATYVGDGQIESILSNEAIGIPTSGTSEDESEVAITRTALNANYPNPFNPTTTIVFSVGAISTSHVSIDIYNIRGQHVRKLVDDVYTDGEHSVVWNGTDEAGRDVASGIYFYRMKTDDFSETRRMILLK
jgi:hypothetical protein